MGDKAQGYSRHTNATLCLAQIVRNSQHHVHPLCGASVQCHAKDSATRQLHTSQVTSVTEPEFAMQVPCRTQSQANAKRRRGMCRGKQRKIYTPNEPLDTWIGFDGLGTATLTKV